MATSTLKQLPKATAEIEINIPWAEIKSTYDEVLTQVSRESELPGFRKGKAPQKIVEGKVDKTKIYEEVIKKIIPKAYAEAVSEHKLQPITSPKIEVVKAKQDQDWTVKATLSLKPKIILKNYKDKIRELKKTKVKIWTPGEGKPDKEEETKKLTVDEIIGALASEAEVELSDELISQEANRLLSELIDQTRQLGLTVEQYLISKGKTNEQLRAEYAQTAKRNLSIEFALAEVADKENITVSQEDLNKILDKVEKPEEKEKLKKDSYYLAHLIRQQKTLDFLSNL
ncbi:MAG: trigger factor, trigger factor [Candidatus Gottesmanbacteria bacterium GW2011_GWA2_43_14]|uniref:Trigger factor n=1 Tax=Candidatus Gottesmanbacteria bacterium GW2011_GWA2_43_14 TaxID=1618443 RepID=A0A0G1FTL0_9BACT|nr:MAG: trigger factor, trigger factor [Candidatus Gottesmanbacteria bacterium GW2011_GWA2_43_14]